LFSSFFRSLSSAGFSFFSSFCVFLLLILLVHRLIFIIILFRFHKNIKRDSFVSSYSLFSILHCLFNFDSHL
jgi:hypothetical protein